MLDFVHGARRAGLVAVALFALVVPAQSEAAGRPVAQAMQPIQATAPRGDGRLFVLERRGLVRVLRGGRLRSRPFLDIRGLVRLPFPHDQYRDQSGAFSLAFAPDYRRSGRFYVLYTGRDHRVHVDEFTRGRGSPEHASARSRRAVLSLRQEGLKDLGGDLAFGPDGHLWISLGQGKHPERSQDLGRLNGKLLRIDPRPAAGRPYTIPPGNPFTMQPGARPRDLRLRPSQSLAVHLLAPPVDPGGRGRAALRGGGPARPRPVGGRQPRLADLRGAQSASAWRRAVSRPRPLARARTQHVRDRRRPGGQRSIPLRRRVLRRRALGSHRENGDEGRPRPRHANPRTSTHSGATAAGASTR